MFSLRQTLSTDPTSDWVAAGIAFLRVGIGGAIFYVHGWHKIVGGIAYLRTGAPWPLLADVQEMGLPAPVAGAFAATAVQFLAAPLLALGCFTRLNAGLLTGVLAGAVAQNLLAGRDPQLAALYTVTVAAFALIGGGRWSVDARLARKRKLPE